MARGQLSMKNGVAQHQQKKQKTGFDCETAVAESQPSPSDDNAENDGGDAWLPTEQPAAALAATAVAAAECSLGGACQAASDDSQ